MDKIWIVQGTTGEYSDRNQWPVCAMYSESAAKEYAELLCTMARATVNDVVRTKTEQWDWDETEAGKLLKTEDPEVSMDYNGTTYTAYSVSIKP